MAIETNDHHSTVQKYERLLKKVNSLQKKIKNEIDKLQEKIEDSEKHKKIKE